MQRKHFLTAAVAVVLIAGACNLPFINREASEAPQTTSAVPVQLPEGTQALSEPQEGEKPATVDSLIAQTLKLRGIALTLEKTSSSGGLSSLKAKIDDSGNQHYVVAYPERADLDFPAEAGDILNTIEVYIVNGKGYGLDPDGKLLESGGTEAQFELERYLQGLQGVGLWLKILPPGSIVMEGTEETGGFQVRRYRIEGNIEGEEVQGSVWIDTASEALVGAELQVPEALTSSGVLDPSGVLEIRFNVEKSDIAPIVIDPSRLAPTPTPTPSTTGNLGTGEDESGASLADDFPIPPDSHLDDDNTYDYGSYGAISILSEASVSSIIDFYETALPENGWTFLYTDNNFIGGVIQHWKKENIYLSLDIGYIDMQLTVFGEYDRIPPDSLSTLPPGLPIPDHAELVAVSDSYWQFYVEQDYSAVASFYQSQLVGKGWAAVPGYGSMGGEGDGDGGSGNQYPPGVNPMPTPTLDPRQGEDSSWTMPDGNQVDISIDPHRNATILGISLVLKQASSSGLPADIPMYEGGTVQSVAPGTVIYTVNESVDTLSEFYDTQLTAAGWEKDGSPFEGAGMLMQAWKKGSEQVMITLTEYGTGGCMVMITCETCD